MSVRHISAACLCFLSGCVTAMCAVPSYSEDVMLIDLERRFRPRLYPFFFPPIVLWVHVIVHLVSAQGPHGGTTTHSVYLLCITCHAVQTRNSHDHASLCAVPMPSFTQSQDRLGSIYCNPWLNRAWSESFVHGSQYCFNREQDCCCCLFLHACDRLLRDVWFC